MTHATLRGTTAMVLVALATCPALAQDTDIVVAGDTDILTTNDEGYLGELVLTGGKRDIAVGSSVARTVIDQEEIEDRQGSTIAQLIDSVPGVSLVNGSTPQGSAISIRGFGSTSAYGTDQKVAILVDDATTGSEELYRIGTQLFTDPYLYKSVEVLRGTIGSFEYGSGIVGGVVKLETIDASDMTGGEPGVKFRQTLGYTSNGEGWSSSSTAAWQVNDKAEFLLNFSYRDVENYKDGSGETIENSDFATPSYLAKAKFYLGDTKEHSLTFSMSQTTSVEKDVPYDQFGTTTDSFGNVDRTTETRTATIKYGYNPAGNDLIDLTATLSYSDQEISSDYISGSSAIEAYYSGISALGDADQSYQTTKLTVKNTSLFQTGVVSHELLTGVEFMHRDREDAYAAPGGVDDRYSIFAIDQMEIGNLTFTPALRYENSSIDPYDESTYDHYENSGWMGGVSAAYKFDSGFAVFGSYALTSSFPIIDSLGSVDDMETLEKAETYEVGASYVGHDLFSSGDSFVVRGNYYWTTLWDITTYTDTSSIEIDGFELEASYALANGFYVDFNGTIAEGESYDDDGEATSYLRAPADGYNLTVGKKWADVWDLSWEMVRATDQYDSSGDELDDTTVHNLRATYRPQVSGFFDDTEVRFGIENAADLDYQSHLSSSSRTAPGRNYKVTVSKLF